MGRHRPDRPSPAQRGYGKRHRELRAQWESYVLAGRVDCTAPLCLVERATGSRRIARSAAWDLGHDETDRRKYAGPQHSECNRGQARRSPVYPAPALDPSAPFDERAWQ